MQGQIKLIGDPDILMKCCGSKFCFLATHRAIQVQYINILYIIQIRRVSQLYGADFTTPEQAVALSCCGRVLAPDRSTTKTAPFATNGATGHFYVRFRSTSLGLSKKGVVGLKGGLQMNQRF